MSGLLLEATAVLPSSPSETSPFFHTCISHPSHSYPLFPLGPLAHKAPQAWCFWVGPALLGARPPLPHVSEAATVFTAQRFFSFLPLFLFFYRDYFMTRDFAFCSSRLAASRALHSGELSGRFTRWQPRPFLLAPVSVGQWDVGADGAGKAGCGFLPRPPWILGCSQGRDPA